MRIAKIGVIALFLFMALGGIGGVMLPGDSFPYSAKQLCCGSCRMRRHRRHGVER